MKKHQLITLLLPFTALASCAPTTPVVNPIVTTSAPVIEHTHKTSSKTTNHVHKHSPKPTKVVKITPPHPIHPSPTHGIPGQPC